MWHRSRLWCKRRIQRTLFILMEPKPSHPQPSNQRHEPAALQPAGLLVVTVDRLPAWMLAAYGSTWVSTPALDALAARGVVFDRLIAPVAAPAAVFHDLFTAVSPAGRSFPAAAEAGGWRPVFVTDDPAMAAVMTEQTAGWSTASVRMVEAVVKTHVEEEDAQTSIARLVDAAVDAIATGGHRMVWCHVGSLGVAWDAPERYRDRYIDPDDPPPPSGSQVPGCAVDADTDPDLVVGIRQVFAGQLTLLDSQLARLFAATGVSGQDTSQRAGNAAPWSILVVGVRGLPLGLHGWVGIGGPDRPYGELVQLPAIFVDAAGRMAAQRYGGLVIPADLGATLAEVGWRLPVGMHALPAGVDPESPWLGMSLATLFENWSAPVRERVVVRGPTGAAIVTPSWHCLLAAGPPHTSSTDGGLESDGRSGAVRLFAKPDDFFELADVANRCAEVAGRLGDLVKRTAAGEVKAAWMAALPTTTSE